MNTLSTFNPRELLLTRLLRGLIQCCDLVKAGDGRIGVHAIPDGARRASTEKPDVQSCNDVLGQIAQHHGIAVPHFVFPAPSNPNSLETAVSNVIGLKAGDWALLAAASGTSELNQLLTSVDLPPGGQLTTVKAEGVPAFNSWACGRASDEAVVLVPPAGVPATLFRPWLEALGHDHFAIVLENPALFGDWQQIESHYGNVQEDAALIHALARAHSLRRVHLVGICGGAPVALAAAANPDLGATSLLICHGDLNFGPATPRTPFQNQFQSYLKQGAASMAAAAQVHPLFLDPTMLFGIQDDLAPCVLYPYANAGLFHRYACSNFDRMSYDSTAAARRIDCETVIITSRGDRIIHPEASRMLHRLVAGSVIREKTTGSHHDALLPTPDMLSIIRDLVREGSNQSAETVAEHVAPATP